MDCHAHPGKPAVAACAGCAEPFCGNCLVTIKGKPYCKACKTMTLAPDVGPTADCVEAGEALKYAIIGIFCFGVILGPVAISKALQAKRMISANPQLTGQGKATAALIIGVIDLVLWVLGIIARVSAGPRGGF